jgi:hypothetical protein
MSVQAEENSGVEQTEQEQQEEQQVESQESAAETPADDGEISISIEGASPPPEEEQEAPAWVKELRHQQRETARRNRELEEENARLKAPQQAAELGAKPTLADHDYDEAAYEEALTAWHDRKAALAAEQRTQEDARKAEESAWQAKANRYMEQKASLKVKDFADAEAAVEQELSAVQQAIIIKGAEAPANIAYALGKNHAELKKLAAIKDPVEFAFAVAKLETKLKVGPRKTAPLPESAVSGTTGVAAANDQLAKLEAEAARTGDRSKVVAYHRAQQQRQRAAS